MGLRELKEAAHQQYVKGKFAECMKTYQKVIRLAPRDPNMRVRHAEACRRAGERMQAIASYREAAHLLLELGCETRARGALKAALELDPHDPVLKDDVARLTPQAAAALDEAASTEITEQVELPPLQPLDGDTDPFAPHALLEQQQALPPIQPALPAAPSVPVVLPPVVLPTPGVRPAALAPRTLPPIARTRPAPGLAREDGSGRLPRVANPGFKPHDSRTLTPSPVLAGNAPPVLHPVGTAAATSRPPPPPAEALLEAAVAPPPQATQVARARMEVRRLSPNVLAFRGSPTDGWALIRSRTPFEIHLVEDLDNLPPGLGDFNLDITEEPLSESASSAMH